MAQARREALHARPDDLLQLRICLWPAGIRRQGHDAGPQVRGEPRIARFTGTQLREGSGGPQPDHRPRPHPPPDASRRRTWCGRMGAHQLGRGARRARAAHPDGDPDRPSQRGDVPRGSSGRGRLHGARARRVGRRRAQLAHERVLVGRPYRLPVLDGHRPSEPGPRERAHDPSRRTWRPGTTSTRMRSASSRPSRTARS